MFKSYKDKKKLEFAEKYPQNYVVEKQMSFENEQKPVKHNDFSNEEDKIIKKLVGKKKKKTEARGS